MRVGFFVSRAAMAEDEDSVAFFDTYPSVRHLYQNVSSWTGLPIEQTLTGELPEEHGPQNAMLAVRSIAGQLARRSSHALAGGTGRAASGQLSIRPGGTGFRHPQP